MILIAGDSWAKGEWETDPVSGKQVLSHGGLARFMIEEGHHVVNLARAGGTNIDAASRLESFLYKPNQLSTNVEKIIVFQTEWHRDFWTVWFLEDYVKFDYKYETIKHWLMSKFYFQLSDISKEHNVPVHVIGGCSDTIWLEKFESEYPGVKIACQSFVNLLKNNDHRVKDPIYSSWGPPTKTIVEIAKQKLDAHSLKNLVNDIDLGGQRARDWAYLHAHGLFCEDRVHPNRHAFSVLYNFLKQDEVA